MAVTQYASERAKARQDLAVTAQLRAALERVEVIR